MKHLTMTFAMLMAVSCIIKAQVVEDVVIRTEEYSRNYFIPSEYAFDKKPHPVYVATHYDDEWNALSRDIEVYDDNFTLVKSFTFNGQAEEADYFFNYDTGMSYGDLEVLVTQTLFNDDENYEYLVKERVNGELTSYKVVSDEGQVLQTITAENGMSLGRTTYIIINGKGYLNIQMYEGDECSYDYFYTKDPKTNGIRQVGAPIKTSVRPAVVGRNEKLTVEFSGNEGNNSVVNVHDASGRNVYRANVPRGQKTLQINSASLNQGLNVVSVSDGKRNGESCKVIVI